MNIPSYGVERIALLKVVTINSSVYDIKERLLCVKRFSMSVNLFLKSIERNIPTLGLKYSHVGTKLVPSRGLFASLKERMLDI